LYGAPTTRTRGCSERNRRSIEPQSGPLCETASAAIGAALRVSVSPPASPIRLSPKSKARTVCGCLSVASGMPGHEAQPLDVDSQQPPGAEPAVLKRQLEDDARIDRHGQPRVVADLAFELTGFPSGIAERDECVQRAFTPGHCCQHIARGSDLD